MYNYLLIGLMVFVYWVLIWEQSLDAILKIRGFTVDRQYDLKKRASGIILKVLLWPRFAAEVIYETAWVLFASDNAILQRDPRIKKL